MSATDLLRNRSFTGLLLANMLLGAAFPIQLILGGLTGLMLAPGPGLVTLPASVQTLAGLLAAAPISLLMGRYGRRAGFVLGAGLTLAGGLGAMLALIWQNFALLCGAHALMGAGWAAFQYFRFAAAEAVDRAARPVAISLMLSALLISAIVGPQVFILAQDALAPVPFAGAYAATSLLAVLGILPLLGVHLPRPATTDALPGPGRRLDRLGAALRSLRRPEIRMPVGIAALAQGIMVFLMVPTPIAMVGCGFSAETASDVIRWHIVAMFAPSFVTGFLVRRIGAERIAALGLVIMLAAAMAAALGLSALHFYGALIILGIGWNFAFIGATTLLDAGVPDTEKAAVQGVNDTVIALVSTLCAFAAGLVLSGLGWAVLAVMSGVLLALGLGVLVLARPWAARI